MPVFNLGPLGRFKLSRVNDTSTVSSTTPLLAKPTRSSSSPSPSLYTAPGENVTQPETHAIEVKHLAPPQAQRPECAIEQLRRYVLEIVALTFSADFDMLNSALYNIPITDGTTTILCDDERANLLALSSVVRKVRTQHARQDISSISESDELTLGTNMIRPGFAIVYCLSFFSLDMIEWYGRHMHHSPRPVPFHSTLPGYWSWLDPISD